MVELHELPWDPLTPTEMAALLSTWDRFWRIAGGWSIDLNTRQVSREHEDLDVLVLRRDIDALHAGLPGWELWYAWENRLHPWPAGAPIPDRAIDIWAREAGTVRWRFQFMVMDHDDEHWIFRRDGSIGGPLASLAHIVDGVPVIALEIQPFYKGNTTNGSERRARDDADFRAALPHLTPEQRDWLRDALGAREPDHPWLPMLDSRNA